jgi:hypothetical protein
MLFSGGIGFWKKEELDIEANGKMKKDGKFLIKMRVDGLGQGMTASHVHDESPVYSIDLTK